MRNLHYIFLFILTHLHLGAQPSFEVTVPLGISNYVNTAVGNDFDYIQSPVHSTPQFSNGLDFDFCPWSLKGFEFFGGISVRILRLQAQQELNQDSYAWTYRNILIHSSDRLVGFHVSPRYNFWVSPKHSLGVQGSYGYLITIRNITTIKMRQNSFYTGSEEEFEYYVSTYPGIRPAIQYSGGLIYVYGQNNFRLKLAAGYEYLDRNTKHFLSTSSRDWQFFYSSIGLKLLMQ